MIIAATVVVEPNVVVSVSGAAADTARSSRGYALALRDTANATLVGRVAQLANALEHLVDLRLEHTEVLDRVELGQMLAQSLIDRQIGGVPVVLEEGPVLFDAVQLTCKVG